MPKSPSTKTDMVTFRIPNVIEASIDGRFAVVAVTLFGIVFIALQFAKGTTGIVG